MKKGWILFLVGIAFVSSGLFLLYQDEEALKQEKRRQEVALEEKRQAIKESYGFKVKTIKESSLYQKEGEEYQKIGTVGEGVSFSLEDLVDDSGYFQIKDTPYYFYYEEVRPSEEIEEEKRYLNYIPFSLLIHTKKGASYYQEDGTFLFTLLSGIKARVIEQDDDFYFFSYFDRLVKVAKNEVEEVEEVEGEDPIALSIPVLNYHFIYLDGDTSCQESICHSEEQIRSHFSYLKDIGAFTITTKELEKFIKGQIQLPQPSVLITIDDGARAENFLPFLEEYGLHATLFLVTSWYPKDMFASSYLELASHTHNLHTVGVCPGGQGSEIRCLGEEEIQEDLKLSRETLENTTAFCYPFYEYNDYAIAQVKKAGFTIGFIGGSSNVTTSTNPYLIPRYPIQSTTGISFLENLFKE